MSNKGRALLASLAVLWVLCSSLLAEMNDTSANTLKQQIQQAIDIPELKLTAEERDSVVNTVESFCVDSPYVYGDGDIGKLAHNVAAFMTHRTEWDRSRDDTSLRKLIHNMDIILLESQLATFEILRNTYGNEVAGAVDKGYLSIVSQAIDKHFADIPDQMRKDFLAEFQNECEAKSASLFTFAGKEPLLQEEMAKVRTVVDTSAEALAAEMKAHLPQVPEDVRESLPQSYLERLRSTLTRQFHLSTHARATAVDAPEGELRDRLIQRNQQRVARLRMAEEQLYDAQRTREQADQAKHNLEIGKYIADQRLAEIGMPTLEVYLSERVQSLLTTLAEAPAGVAESAAETLPASNAAPTERPGQARSGDLSGNFWSDNLWLVLGTVVLLVGVCVLCLRKWPRSLGCIILCVAAAVTVMCSTQPFASVCPAAERHAEQEVILGTKVSKELGAMWQELLPKRTECTTDMPESAHSVFVRIKDAVAQQLKLLDQSQQNPHHKRVALSMIYDLVDYSKRLPIDDAADTKVGDDIVKFYVQLYGDMRSPHVDMAIWQESVRREVQSQLKEDCGPVRLATWSSDLKAELQHWWWRYCVLRMPHIEQGVAYGRRISSSPWIHDDKLLGDSYVRQLSRCHVLLTQRLVMSERTRAIVRGGGDK